MHFLFFSAQYLPTAGGVERFTAELSRTLAGMGHAVTIATSALPGLPDEETDTNGVRIFRLPSRLFMGGRFPVVRPGKTLNTLSQKLWAHNYDFAVVNTRFYPLSLWGAAQCRKHGVPALVLEHGTKHLSLDNPVLNLLGNGYEHAMMRLVRRQCDDIYGISQASAQWLRHFHVRAAGVIYNAVDVDGVQAIAENPPRHFRLQYGIPQDAPLVCFVGRFIVEKGVRELLEAFRLLRQHMPDARLIMAGDGPLLADVRAAKPHNVILTGTLPHADTVALMAQSDVFCLPTYSEGFSTTILEAAAAGCCIVTTPTGGSPELIQDEKSGILLRDIQPAAIAEVLGDVLATPAFCKGAGEAARQTAADRFSWAATAGHLVQIATARAKGANTRNDGDEP